MRASMRGRRPERGVVGVGRERADTAQDPGGSDSSGGCATTRGRRVVHAARRRVLAREVEHGLERVPSASAAARRLVEALGDADQVVEAQRVVHAGRPTAARPRREVAQPGSLDLARRVAGRAGRGAGAAGAEEVELLRQRRGRRRAEEEVGIAERRAATPTRVASAGSPTRWARACRSTRSTPRRRPRLTRRGARRRSRVLGALGHLHVDQVAGPRDEVVTCGARRDDERDETSGGRAHGAPRSRARRAQPNPCPLGSSRVRSVRPRTQSYLPPKSSLYTRLGVRPRAPGPQCPRRHHLRPRRRGRRRRFFCCGAAGARLCSTWRRLCRRTAAAAPAPARAASDSRPSYGFGRRLEHCRHVERARACAVRFLWVARAANGVATQHTISRKPASPPPMYAYLGSTMPSRSAPRSDSAPSPAASSP